MVRGENVLGVWWDPRGTKVGKYPGNLKYGATGKDKGGCLTFNWDFPVSVTTREESERRHTEEGGEKE